MKTAAVSSRLRYANYKAELAGKRMSLIRQYIKGDRIIWTVILVLFMISLLSVYSSTGSLAYKNMSGDTMYYLFRQFKFILLGFLTIVVVHLIPFRYYNWLAGIAIFIAVPLLLYTLIYGKDLNEASRWLYIPGMGSRTFQPSEFAKVALIMYIARVLAVNQNNISDFKGVFLKLIIAISLVCILILPANLSTAAIIFTVAFVLMFVGRVPARYLFMIVVTGAAGLAIFLLVSNAMSSEGRITTWKNRIETFVSGEGDNFQANQAKVAIVRGGFLPNGPGTSTQRNLLPHPYSDFIFAIIIEEYGSIIGGVLLIILYLWLLFRTGVIVRRSKSTFGAFLAFGLALGLVFQAFVNMGVTVGLLPVTGQTLPLVSMGGTSVIFTSMSLGMILSVSWGIKKDIEEEEALQNEEVANEQSAEI
ncbi:MAG TPA: FtsW/RodA/SpoVE family cell cycle protein [Bacteroidales bacterium]|nr:FtsW/RodA/SpoVE family cell cycle protein [Bacteroidales bacterium]